LREGAQIALRSGSLRSRWPLAHPPVLGEGQGCISRCNQKPNEKGKRHEGRHHQTHCRVKRPLPESSGHRRQDVRYAGHYCFTRRRPKRDPEKVETFDSFTADNDPHHEHDFGNIDYEGLRIFWKIDYYDRASFGTGRDMGSEDPSDPAQTLRVLTIMLASEY
jgi:hypothetical protein